MQHIQKCIKKSIPCPLQCGAQIKSYQDGLDHYKLCSFAKEKFHACKEYLIRKDMNNHTSDHLRTEKVLWEVYNDEANKSKKEDDTKQIAKQVTDREQ